MGGDDDSILGSTVFVDPVFTSRVSFELFLSASGDRMVSPNEPTVVGEVELPLVLFSMPILFLRPLHSGESTTGPEPGRENSSVAKLKKTELANGYVELVLPSTAFSISHSKGVFPVFRFWKILNPKMLENVTFQDLEKI